MKQKIIAIYCLSHVHGVQCVGYVNAQPAFRKEQRKKQFFLCKYESIFDWMGQHMERRSGA